MYCKKCGNLLNAGDTVCKNCGEVVTPQPNQETNVTSNNNQSVNVEVPGAKQTNGTTNVTPEMPQQNNVGPVNETSNVGMHTNNVSQQINMQNDTVSTPQQMDVGETQVQQNTTMNQPQTMNVGEAFTQSVTPANTQNINNNSVGNKNNKSFFIIIVIILAIIIVGLLGVLLYKNLLGNNTNNNINNSSNVNNSENNNTQSDNNNVSSVTNKNTVTYNGFEFIVPEGYTYKTENNFIDLVNKDARVAVRATVIEYARLTDVENNVDVFKSELNSIGITVTSSLKNNYEGSDWYIFNCTDGTNNYSYGFMDLGDYYVFNTLVLNIGNLSNDKVFADLTKMANTATYNGTNQFSNSDNQQFEVNVNKYKFDLSI